MRSIPKHEWCFLQSLLDDNQAKEDRIHQNSLAKQFLVFDFLMFDTTWTHFSNGAQRPETVTDAHLGPLVEWGQSELEGLKVIQQDVEGDGIKQDVQHRENEKDLVL